MVSQISNFGITGYHNPAAPPTVVGSIVGLLYWHEGLAGWASLPEPPPEVPLGTAFHLAPQWLNQSAEPISGHIELTITKPDGTKFILNDVLYQNNWAAPGNGWGIQFEPFTMDQAGTYKVTATLSSVGQTLAEETFELVATALELPSVGITILKINGREFVEVGTDSDGLPYGVLGSPVEASVLPGLSVTYRNDSIHFSSGYIVALIFALFYEPTWEAGFPCNAPPAYRRGCSPPESAKIYVQGRWAADAFVATCSITSCFATGYYCPGLYNAYLMWAEMDYAGNWWNQYYFRVKNAVLCSGEGLLQI